MDVIQILPWLLCIALLLAIFVMELNIRPRLKKEFWRGIKLSYVTPDDAPNVAGELWLRSLSLRFNNSRGSGFALDNEYGLTAYHVFFDKQGNLRAATAQFSHGLFPNQKVSVVASDKEHDIVLFKFETPLSFPFKPMMVSDEELATMNEDTERDVTTSDIVFIMAPRPSGNVWLQGAIYFEEGVSDITVINFGEGEPQDCVQPGDSGSVGLDVFGNIRTVVIYKLKSKKEGFVAVEAGGGVHTGVIRTFLKAHWPNYQG